MPIYTLQNLYDDANRSSAAITNILRLANRAARYVVSDLDLASTKRKAYLSPNLSEGQFDYKAPTDLKDQALIDIRRVEGRLNKDKFDQVNTEYFDRMKSYNQNLVCVEQFNSLQMIRVSCDLDLPENKTTVHNMDSVDDNGTWSTVLDASNITEDDTIFVEGSASLNFDMNVGASTTIAGYIVNSDMDEVDLSDYTSQGSIFLWVYAPTVTGLDSVTLRIGSSASDYYSISVTTTNENLAFYTGWMLLRFDFNGATETGTVDDTAIDYVRLALDQGSSGTIPLNSLDWRVDYLVARKGKQHEVWYYTKYPWQTSSGTYLENATATTDLLNADGDEYELFVLKFKEMIAQDLLNFDDAKEYREAYQVQRSIYQSNYKSERLIIKHVYQNLDSNPGLSWLP